MLLFEFAEQAVDTRVIRLRATHQRRMAQAFQKGITVLWSISQQRHHRGLKQSVKGLSFTGTGALWCHGKTDVPDVIG